MAFSLSIVIPNYNGKNLLQKNLPSLFAALEHCGSNWEVIVSDDASTDDSIAFLKKEYSVIKIIENKTNRGFSFTINEGFSLSKNDLVLAVNTDVSLDKNYFRHPLKYFEKADTFGVAGSIYSEDGKTLQDAAKFPKKGFLKINTTKNYALKKPTAEWIPSFFLSGANVLMDRKKLMLLQGMETLYSPFYYEDSDLGLRAWKCGWHCYYEPQAVCYHPLSETINKHNSRKKIKTIVRRNRFYFHAIHLDNLNLVFWYPSLVLHTVFRIFLMDVAYYKSLSLFLKAFPHVLQTKKKNRELYLSQKNNNTSTESVINTINDFAGKHPHILF